MHANASGTGARLGRRAVVAATVAGALAGPLTGRDRPASAQEATPGAGSPSAGADADLAERIRATERDRLRALVEADVAVAERLHADDFQLVNPIGGTLSKEEYLGGIASGDIDYLVFEPASEIRVRLYGEAAVIRYRSNLQISLGGQDPGAVGHFWHTDVYEQRGGRWQVVWSQATEILE